MEITSKSKLFDVLKEYPDLEDKIINIAPTFKNLKNPVLRRTVGQLATLDKVAQIGNIEGIDLVNTLRREIGQPEISAEAKIEISIPENTDDDPDWIIGEPQHIVNGTEMLQRGEVPLNHVNELLETLHEDGFILLLTDFEPIPIMDAMRQKDRDVYHKTHPNDDDQHLTYIC